jgi:hypothetical protein
MQRYETMDDQRLKMVAELKALIPRRDTLKRAILFRQSRYTWWLTRLPKTDFLNEISASRLYSVRLTNVMKHDKILGESMLELYQIQKKMRAYCDLVEELMHLEMEHFVIHKQKEDQWRRARIAIAIERRSIRNMGPELLKILHFQMAMAESVA